MPLFIVCCVHRSSDSQCFSMGRTTPKIAPSSSISGPPSNTWLLGPTRVYPTNDQFSHFAGLTNMAKRQTRRHIDRPRYSVCSSRPHLTVSVMRPKIKKPRESNISSNCWHAPTWAIALNFDMRGDVADAITRDKFCYSRFRGFRVLIPPM